MMQRGNPLTLQKRVAVVPNPDGERATANRPHGRAAGNFFNAGKCPSTEASRASTMIPEQLVSADGDSSLDLRGELRSKTWNKVKGKAQVAADGLRRGSGRCQPGVSIAYERVGTSIPQSCSCWTQKLTNT